MSLNEKVLKNIVQIAKMSDGPFKQLLIESDKTALVPIIYLIYVNLSL